MADVETLKDALYDAIIDGDIQAVPGYVSELLALGQEPIVILNEAMVSAMDVVGEQFEQGVYFVPEMLVSAHAMKAGLNILRPLLAQTDVEPVGKVVIGTVQGDVHDIGKNLVTMMLEGGGFEVVDLGVNVPAEQFVEAARDGVDLVAMSALLTTTIVNMPVVLEALETAGLRARVKTLVGGAPVTQAFADKIGADGYAEDASRAVALAKALIGIE